MSAVIDVSIHAETFRNIDLFQQGLYAVQYQIYYKTKKETHLADPYSLDTVQGRRKAKVKTPHHMSQSKIIDYSKQFQTRVFLIRYCDEVVEVNDTCFFRLELPLKQNFNNKSIYLKANLLFQDQNKRGLSKQSNSQQRQDKFDNVFSVTFKINGAVGGCCEYLPIIFDLQHFCLINTLVSIVVVDIRLPTGGLILDSDGQYDNSQATIEEQICQSYFQNGADDEKINNIYNRVVSILAHSYDCIKNSINDLYHKALIGVRDNIEIDMPQNIQIPLYKCDEVDKNLSFAERISTKDPQIVAKILFQEFYQICSRIITSYCELQSLFKQGPIQIRRYLQAQYNNDMKSHCSEFIINDQQNSWELFSDPNLNTKSHHQNIANQIRINPYIQNLKSLKIQQIQAQNYFTKIPIIFQDIQNGRPKQTNFEIRPSVLPRNISNANRHLIVLVHGFQGNSLDMRVIKSYIAMVYPESVLLSSKSNENRTTGFIDEMGANLAHEVSVFLLEWFNSTQPKKISFIGHSLGGLIIRAALPHLEAYKDSFYSFISFSSPHLGLLYSNSSLIDFGI